APPPSYLQPPLCSSISLSQERAWHSLRAPGLLLPDSSHGEFLSCFRKDLFREDLSAKAVSSRAGLNSEKMHDRDADFAWKPIHKNVETSSVHEEMLFYVYLVL
ncbi:hypothetical protein H1C71_012356, partial [Ictidomys tridecemlineatus]